MTRLVLPALARGLLQRPDLRLRPGPWALVLVRPPELQVDPAVLAGGAPEAADLGCLAHECAHFWISRYTLFEPRGLPPAVWALAMNAIEDPRANLFVQQRLPGTERWIAAMLARDRAASPAPTRSRLRAFLAACSVADAYGFEPPDWLLGGPPEALQAFLETDAARRAYATTLPPHHLRLPVDADALAELLTREAGLDAEALVRLSPSGAGWEPHVTLVAARAQAIAEREILPVVQRLLDADAADLAGPLGQGAKPPAGGDARGLGQWIEDRLAGEGGTGDARSRSGGGDAIPDGAPAPAGGGGGGGRAAGRRVGGEDPLAELLDTLVRILEEADRRGRGSAPDGGLGTGGAEPPPDPQEALRQALELLVRWLGEMPPLRADAPPTLTPRAARSGGTRAAPAPPAGSADIPELRRRVSAQVTPLLAALRRRLRPTRRLRSGFASGRRVDLGRLMAFEATGRGGDALWMRPVPCQRQKAAVHLLVDLSGSMNRRSKIEAAMAATVLFAETLARLGEEVEWAIDGFQDELVPVKDYGERPGPAVWRRIAGLPLEVAGRRPGGHNRPKWNDDGPCLREAGARLRARRAPSRLLVVLSDGLPEGRRSDADDLREAVAELVRDPSLDLVGIGVGPGTEHVRDFYPVSLASVPLDELATRLAGLLEHHLAVR